MKRSTPPPCPLSFLTPHLPSALVVRHNPLIQATRVIRNLRLREPVPDLMHRRLWPVRAVANVAANADSHVTTDGARYGSGGVGRSEEDTTGLNGVLAFPDHGDDGPGREVGDEALFWKEDGKERSGMQGGR